MSSAADPGASRPENPPDGVLQERLAAQLLAGTPARSPVGVVERLLAPPEGFETVSLRGNHEQTLLDFLDDASIYPAWKDFGGRETLLSIDRGRGLLGYSPAHRWADHVAAP